MSHSPNSYLIIYEKTDDYGRYITNFQIKKLTDLFCHSVGASLISRNQHFEVFELYVEVGREVDLTEVNKVLCSYRADRELEHCEEKLNEAKDELEKAKSVKGGL